MSTQLATGFRNVAPAATTNTLVAPGSPFPLTLITAANNLANAGTTIANAAGIAGIWPDLYSVYCASKTLCFAAGGYPAFPTLAPPAVPTQLVNGLPTFGQVLRSVNGGTAWSVRARLSLPAVPAPSSAATETQALSPQWTPLPYAPVTNPAAGTTFGPVGALNAIATDASGRHVFAVGAPTVMLTTVGVPGSAANTLGIAAGTILACRHQPHVHCRLWQLR